MRAGIVVSIALALAIGSAPVANTQEPDVHHVFGSVTGTVRNDSSSQEQWRSAWLGGNVVHVRDWHVERQIDWSDPRLPPDMVSSMNVDTWLAEQDIVQLFSESVRLEDADGAWAGTTRAIGMDHGQAPVRLMTLTGEGVYQGLSAVFVTEVARNDEADQVDQVVYRGYIFEGEMPPLPEPIAPGYRERLPGS